MFIRPTQKVGTRGLARAVDHIVPKPIARRPSLYSRRHIDLLRVAGALCRS
ncbi:putative leader peptide [Streptomyces sp. B21-083]|uniref:putative leader peptide n=1 Tax=Streptomyces sp. B21-083 TaxID=3039410 RepID=UPI003FA6E73F